MLINAHISALLSDIVYPTGGLLPSAKAAGIVF